jgi:hypothetical protein
VSSVVFDEWRGINRPGWIGALVSDGAVDCVECGVSVTTNETAYKHTGDLGTYCQACSDVSRPQGPGPSQHQAS